MRKNDILTVIEKQTNIVRDAKVVSCGKVLFTIEYLDSNLGTEKHYHRNIGDRYYLDFKLKD